MALADGITVMGSPLNPAQRNALSKCTLSGSMTSITQIDMTFSDPGWTVLQSGLFALNQRVELGGFRMELSAIETGDDSGIENFTLKCRALAYRLLKFRQGYLAVFGVSPSDFVKMECDAVGISCVTQPSMARALITRDVYAYGQKPDIANPPSSWTTIQRLAQEIGFFCWESHDTIYFGQPSWLLQHGLLDEVDANYGTTTPGDTTRLLTVPNCNRTLDDPAVTVSASKVVASADELRPGKVLNLGGVPTFSGKYLISSMNIQLLDPLNIVEFEATTAVNPWVPYQIYGPWYNESTLTGTDSTASTQTTGQTVEQYDPPSKPWNNVWHGL